MEQIFRKIQRSVKDIAAHPQGGALGLVRNIYNQLVSTLQDKDKQLQKLTRAYVGAFALIALLSVLGHMVSVYGTSKQRENAEVIFTMTNLRSQVDVIVSQAATFKASGDLFDDELLSQSLERLKKGRKTVEDYHSSALNKVFSEPPYLLSEKLDKFVIVADDFIKLKRTHQKTEATAALNALSGELSKVLTINLDLALQQYREDVVSQIELSYTLQYLSVITIIVVLVLEAAFIFRPLVIRLGEYHLHLIKIALTDVLTGINNRRAFMQKANEALSYYNRHKTPFALVLMDLDHFKSINDTYGHKVGDLVLQHYAALMQKNLRSYDTLGRIGGEEFAIFLPQITADEAQALIERFRKNVAESTVSYKGENDEPKTLNYTSSFGIIAVSQGSWTLDELFIKADEELYKAKESGRNRVVLTKL